MAEIQLQVGRTISEPIDSGEAPLCQCVRGGIFVKAKRGNCICSPLEDK